MDEDDILDELPTDGDRRTFETQYAGRPPSIAIVEAIAAIEGIQSPDIEFTLYESIDPEALDTLFDDRKTAEEATSETETGAVAEFRVNDYVVNVNADGSLTIEAPEEPE